MNIFRFLIFSGFYGLAELGARALQAAALFWLATVCSKEEYGGLGLLLALQQLVSILVLGGLVESSTSLLNEHRNQDRLAELFVASRRLLLFSAAIVALVYAVSLPWVSDWMGGISPVLHLLVVSTGILLAYFTLASNLFRLDEHHKSSLVLKVLPVASCYVAALAFAWLLPDRLFGFFLGSVIGLLFAQLVWSLSPKPEGAATPVKRDLLRTVFVRSGPVIPIVLIAWVSGYGINFGIDRIFSRDAVAEFTFVLTLNSALLLTSNSLNNVWSPRFFKLSLERTAPELEELNSTVNRAMMLLASTAAGVILLYFGDVAQWVGGNLPAYVHLAPFLALTFCSFVFQTIYFRSINYYFLHQEQYVYMKIFLFSTALGVAAWYAAMIGVGWKGIYLGYFLMMAVRSGAVFWYARRRWGVRLNFLEIPVGVVIVGGGYFLSVGVAGVVLRTACFALLVAGAMAYLYSTNPRLFRNLLATVRTSLAGGS